MLEHSAELAPERKINVMSEGPCLCVAVQIKTDRLVMRTNVQNVANSVALTFHPRGSMVFEN